MSESAPDSTAPPPSRAARIEDGAVIVALLLLAVIPTAQVIARLLFDAALTAASGYVRHLVVWGACLTGIVATRERQHLSLSAGLPKLPAPYDRWTAVAATTITVAVTTGIAVSAASLTLVGFGGYERVGAFPKRAVLAILPVGFGLMALRMVLAAARPQEEGRSGRAGTVAGVLGIALGVTLSTQPLSNLIVTLSWETGAGLPAAIETALLDGADAVNGALRSLRLPLLILMIVSAVAGVPIFAVLGGIALLMFASNGVLETVPGEAYTMLIGVHVPALPLFALSGFLLSESGAGARLVRLCTALFSRYRGGLIIAATLICAYFTTFTGASGVTILAVGGLLAALLAENGFRKDLSTGLLTASGSIGLLFPPSLPIIMYGVVSQNNIKAMFAGGVGPGILLVFALIAFALVRARMARRAAGATVPSEGPPAAGAPGAPVPLRDVGRALRDAGWEVALPVIILGLLFGGVTNLVETSAIAVVYLLVVQMVIHRDLSLRDLPRLFAKAAPIIGGILVILGVAKALSFAIVDAQVPQALVQWFSDHVRSPFVFLILLNLALLVAGCLMDIFSAIVVLVPLLTPIAESYGIDPVHLGIIFLANLELGYLTPPVGLNLFLASYRFEIPLAKLYRTTLPFLAILLVSVLVITYVPPLTTTLVSLLGLSGGAVN
ncbi:MAG: TRAP transporter large permease subunit [Spirochaetaceae bacterium]|nr:TRAP transporter large permease subunit [Spirochaetaceae bacterium]